MHFLTIVLNERSYLPAIFALVVACGGEIQSTPDAGPTDAADASRGDPLSCRQIGDEEGCQKRSDDCFWLVPGTSFPYCSPGYDPDAGPGPHNPPHLPSAGCVALGHDSSPGPLHCRNGVDTVPCPHGEICGDYLIGRGPSHHMDCIVPIPICWDLEK